jgi:hypothetical protein
MKLSPPASSSDLDAAREIARRLHQRRRRQDRPAGPEETSSPLRTPRARAEAPAPLAPPVRPEPVTPPPVSEATPAPPSWDEPESQPAFPGDAGDPLAGFGDPIPASQAAVDTGGNPPELEAEEAVVSPEEMVGSADGLPFDPLPEPVEAPSPFDVELDEDDTSPEGAFGAPAPPTWDDIVETCLGLAQASGAMLVDPSGQVVAARGEWPEPGPDAIAAKLVSTMARTLKDAPTRSISAPLMGRHLTAWRVPLTEGLVTAAFIADAPVRAEARPGIDTEIHRGAGA